MRLVFRDHLGLTRWVALVCVAFLVPMTTVARAGATRIDIAVTDPRGDGVLDAVVSFHPIDAATGAVLPGRVVPRDASDSIGHAVMDQIDLSFAPHVLSIEAGTLVDFPNKDQVRHSIYSFSAPLVFEVKLYRGHEAPPIYFDRPGLVVLGCNIHDDMLGYVYVHDTPHSAVTDEGGRASISGLTVGPYVVRVRHPRLDASLVVERRVDVVGDATIDIALGETPPQRRVRARDDELDGLFGDGAL